MQPAAVTLVAAVGTVTTLSAAQLAIARSYGFPSWNALKLEVERRTVLDDGDLSRLSDLLAKRPELATMEMDRWLDPPLDAAPRRQFDDRTQHDRVEALLAALTT